MEDWEEPFETSTYSFPMTLDTIYNSDVYGDLM